MTTNKSILIIDDDEDDRSLFIDAVNEVDSSIKCIAISSGTEALLLLRTENFTLPDFIFLDLNMPCLNGKQYLVQVKKDPRLMHIPVIIYSTTRRDEDVEETKRLGASYFLTKPILFSEICRSIIFVMEKKWRNDLPLE